MPKLRRNLSFLWIFKSWVFQGENTHCFHCNWETPSSLFLPSLWCMETLPNTIWAGPNHRATKYISGWKGPQEVSGWVRGDERCCWGDRCYGEMDGMDGWETFVQREAGTQKECRAGGKRVPGLIKSLTRGLRKAYASWPRWSLYFPLMMLFTRLQLTLTINTVLKKHKISQQITADGLWCSKFCCVFPIQTTSMRAWSCSGQVVLRTIWSHSRSVL